MALRGLHMVIIMQSELDKAVEQYQAIGMHVAFHVPGKWVELLLPDDTRMAFAVTQETAEMHHTGVILKVDAIEEFCKKLVDAGFEIVDPLHETPFGFVASIKDISNNVLDIVQPTKEQEKTQCCQPGQCKDK